MPEFAANAIAWYRKGPDGKTPYGREFGRKWKKQPFEFGEKISIKEAVERGSGAVKRDWEPRNVEGRYVGHHMQTGAVLIMTSEGIKHGLGGMQLPAEQRWTLEGWITLRGLPWDVRTRQRRPAKNFADGEAQQEASWVHFWVESCQNMSNSNF